MNYAVVIPAYNESQFIALTLDSLVAQTLLPAQVVVVDDNSTDSTAAIVESFSQKHPFITLVQNRSDSIHLPGSKVIRAFQKGLEKLNPDYDVIVKLDADLILPQNYFETVLRTFQSDEKVGMAGGFAYIEKNGDWVLESLTGKDHIRGAFKAYRKALFEQMGGLKPAMGWDTVDELLARYYGWAVVTIPDLKVKHLKPTGANYDKTARYKQGESFYTLGYDMLICVIASAKLALRKKKPLLLFDYINGYKKAKAANIPLLVDEDQAAFIRKYRWMKMTEKLGV